MITDLKEVDDRLTRLENKIKINFFEIEKKLLQSEQPQTESPISDLKERIEQLEDLQMYLELENISGYGSHVVLQDQKLPSIVMQKIDEFERKLASSNVTPSAELRELLNIQERRVNTMESVIQNIRHTIDVNSRLNVSSKLDDVSKLHEQIDELLDKRKQMDEYMRKLNENIDRTSSLLSSVEIINKNFPQHEDQYISGTDKLKIIESEMRKEIEESKMLHSRLNNLYEKMKYNILDTRDFEARSDKIEKDMEMKAQKFLTENLERFAETLDKKLPQLMSESALIDKLVSLQSVDLKPLQQQIDNLKLKVDYVYNYLRTTHGRAPVVVE